MDFLNFLDESRKELALNILDEESFSLEDKLTMLQESNFDAMFIDDAKIFLTKCQMISELEEALYRTPDHFLSLLPNEDSRDAAKFFLERKEFDQLSILLAKHSSGCQKAFERYMKHKDNTPLKIVVKAVYPKWTNFQEKKQENDERSGSKANVSDKTTDDCLASSDEDEVHETANEPQWSPNVTPEYFEKFPQCLNILVLGETGVGKSTFLNGMVNNLKYNNMQEAVDNGVEVLIRTSFTHTDEHGNRMKIEKKPTIKTAEKENEVTQKGQSSTQDPKAYQFEWGPVGKKKIVRLIDTPGVGDVRGLQQEQENFQKILSFIADYHEIHAILILMKPNEARLTLTYKYCITELLSHLHASASKNILFCFTHARDTLYRAGESLPILKGFLDEFEEKRGIHIPVEKDTVYLFDNESFRFLCAWDEGVDFKDKHKNDFDKSWKKTVEETFRLFKKISELQPHLTEKTLSVNNIRQVIVAMARPLAEITKNQMTNAQLITDKLKKVNDLKEHGEYLKTNELYVDQVTIIAEEIDYPVTVCAADSCVEIYKVNDAVHDIYYKTKCHARCFLDGIKKGHINNPQIQGCACFSRGGINHCDVCGCDWKTHIHIRVELRKLSDRVVDPKVRDSIKNYDSDAKQTEIFIQELEKKKKSLENEAATIRGHCAEFAAFLGKNCMTTYNDAYMEYVEHLIREENNKLKVGRTSNEMLQQLEKHRDEYAEQVQILESFGSQATSSKNIYEIYHMLDELRHLKDCGSLIQEIENLEMLSVRKEHANRVTNVDAIQNGWINGMYQGNRSAFQQRRGSKMKSGRQQRNRNGP